MDQYLESTDIIDWENPQVLSLARSLAAEQDSETALAKATFEWVRDHVPHTMDVLRGPVTCAASEVLRHRTGFCYAKSHLLAALLRANGIPAALCYQRLWVDGEGSGMCLHGLNAVHLTGFGWYRIDPRGNKPGVDARFVPPIEQLAFGAEHGLLEDVAGLFSSPLAVVVDALRRHSDFRTLAGDLPDRVADRV
jgi:transglutaminase-like putative cysteine protease